MSQDGEEKADSFRQGRGRRDDSGGGALRPAPRKTKARWRGELAATKAGKRGGVPGLAGASFDVPS